MRHHRRDAHHALCQTDGRRAQAVHARAPGPRRARDGRVPRGHAGPHARRSGAAAVVEGRPQLPPRHGPRPGRLPQRPRGANRHRRRRDARCCALGAAQGHVLDGPRAGPLRLRRAGFLRRRRLGLPHRVGPRRRLCGDALRLGRAEMAQLRVRHARAHVPRAHRRLSPLAGRVGLGRRAPCALPFGRRTAAHGRGPRRCRRRRPSAAVAPSPDAPAPRSGLTTP
mmetsp:Transcript_7871/g.25713  ORF Transcript_7871/g.25713 Transcript_7871/m.25713 type:complete len:225 (-) Transcript_7871:26-700(-)